MRGNIIKQKSYDFSIRIVLLTKFLKENRNEYILSKQILRSGTSIGAMVHESEHAESKADFIHKLSIALKEANETEYWLSLLKDCDLITVNIHESMKSDLTEILKLLISIIKSTKKG